MINSENGMNTTESTHKHIQGVNPIRPGWPNSQLPFRNLLLYDAQTLWLLVFIFKTYSDQILAKLINRGGGGGGGGSSFFIKSSRKIFQIKKFSSAWKLLKLTWEVNFESRRTILDIKKSLFFLKLNPFSGGKYPNSVTCSLLQREILWRHISRNSKATRLRHAFMTVLTHAKFYFSRLMVTLIFGIWASEPPSPSPPGQANDWKGRAW